MLNKRRQSPPWRRSMLSKEVFTKDDLFLKQILKKENGIFIIIFFIDSKKVSKKENFFDILEFRNS